MEFVDIVWGFWNGLTAWIVLVVHIFGGWSEYPIFDTTRNGNWYAFGFLLGAGSPVPGRRRSWIAHAHRGHRARRSRPPLARGGLSRVGRAISPCTSA